MMSSVEDRLAEYSASIDALVARFGGHQGIDRPALIHWLRQFQAEHIPLMIRFLGRIDYFSRANISALCRDLVELVFAHLASIARERILFLIPGDPWEGDAYMARVLRYQNILPSSQISNLIGLTGHSRGDWDAVIILKDFSGTGSQLAEWWRNTGEALILPLEARIVMGILVLNQPARVLLEGVGFTVLSPHELSERNNVFHPNSPDFSDKEQQIILHYCQITGASNEYIRGYGENGLTVAFDYGCPNNSLPILWYTSKEWIGLFRRHGL